MFGFENRIFREKTAIAHELMSALPSHVWFNEDDPVVAAIGGQIGLWSWSFGDNKVFWSDRMLEIVGLPRSEFEPTRFGVRRLIHPDDVDRVVAYTEQVVATGERFRTDYRLLHSSGTYLIVRAEASLIYSEDGTPLGLVGVTLDISSESRALEDLRASEARLGTLASNFDGAIFRYRLNPNGTDAIDYMSQGAERVWGLSPEDIVGDPGKVWATVHPEDVAGVEQAFAEGTRTQSKLVHRWRVVTPEEQVKWIECRASPKFDPDTQSTVWDGSVLDISEMMAAREDLRGAMEMLGQSQKLEAVGRIAGGIAHDFNNLLAIIMGNAELLDIDEAVHEEVETRDAILAACQKGADLTRRLLSFARKSQLRPRRVALSSVVDGMLPLIRRTLPEDIDIHWTHERADEAQVEVDVGMLESSLLNIMVNARDAMPSGGTLTLSLGTHTVSEDKPLGTGNSAAPGNYLALRISDTGTGIPAELIDRVTEPFVSTKGPEMGSGLGLAMVDGFVAQSGGFLEIESAEGLGTQISLFIPAVYNTIEADSTSERSDAPEADDALEGRVLLVEDEEEVRLVVSRILRRMGLQVDGVSTALEATAYLDSDGAGFDLLITDLILPGQTNGIELAYLVRGRLPDVPILMLTGYSPDSLGEGRNLADLGPVMTKPVEAAKLRAAVLQALQPGAIRTGA